MSLPGYDAWKTREPDDNAPICAGCGDWMHLGPAVAGGNFWQCQTCDAPEAKIVTVRVYPPIPIRCFDWCAYFDGDEEGGLRGWGTTEQQAIADLIENVE